MTVSNREDRESLYELWSQHGTSFESDRSEGYELADAILASSWLAGVRAEAAAEQREKDALPTVDALAESLIVHRRRTSTGSHTAYYREMAEDVLSAIRAAVSLVTPETSGSEVNAASDGEASVGQLGRDTPKGIGAGLPDADTAASLPELVTPEETEQTK